MGAVLSIFWRKKKSSIKELEELEFAIQSIEKYNANVEHNKKNIHRSFLYLSCIFVSACAYFCVWKLNNLKEQVIFALGLSGLFLLNMYLKKIMTWYCDRKIRNNRSKLFDLREKKRIIISKVIDTETYKVAKEILEKYAPEKIASKESIPSNPLALLPVNRNASKAVQIKRPLPHLTVGATSTGTVQGALMPVNPPGVQPAVSRVDRILEYLLGDGPSQRYALICKSCQTHNGMALKEEFPYIGFKCCCCQAANPPRVMRPLAPQLNDISLDPISSNSTDQISDNEDVGNEAINGVNESEANQKLMDKPTGDTTLSEDCKSE